MKTIDFTANNGFKYKARLLTDDDRFGLDGCLKHSAVHGRGEPVVEFYVQTPHTEVKKLAWAGIVEPWFFVSRYYISSFRGNDTERRAGLCLDGGMREYDLTYEDCHLVDLWLKKVHRV